MSRGKESSNRIELSSLVQDLLNFGVLGSLRVWGWGGGWMGVGGGWGCPPHGGVDGWGWGVVGGAPHTCAHACACMHMHARTCARVKHDNFMQLPPPLGESLGIPYDVICACACMHMPACVCMCTCVGGTLSTTPHPHPPSPPTPRGDPGISQNSIALELIEIFQFRLKI